MKKNSITLLLLLLIISVLSLAASAQSATINIGLTIKSIEETETTDGQPNEEGDGASFSFMPTDPGLHEEKEFKLRVITNTDFELEYFWERFETVDPRIVAFLNIDEEKYVHEFNTSDDFNSFLTKKLTVGKNVGFAELDNTIRKSKVKLESSELNLDPDDPLDFKIIYDPMILTGSYVEGEAEENILRVIITFLPPKG
jgi:hypothetical protein